MSAPQRQQYSLSPGSGLPFEYLYVLKTGPAYPLFAAETTKALATESWAIVLSLPSWPSFAGPAFPCLLHLFARHFLPTHRFSVSTLSRLVGKSMISRSALPRSPGRCLMTSRTSFTSFCRDSSSASKCVTLPTHRRGVTVLPLTLSAFKLKVTGRPNS